MSANVEEALYSRQRDKLRKAAGGNWIRKQKIENFVVLRGSLRLVDAE